MSTLLAADYPTFTPAMLAFLNEGSNEDIADSYCDAFKDAHGIKARWVLSREYTRVEWAGMWVQLLADIDDELARDAARAEAFKAHIASLGLTEWAEREGITDEYSLMDYNDRKAWEDRQAA